MKLATLAVPAGFLMLMIFSYRKAGEMSLSVPSSIGPTGTDGNGREVYVASASCVQIMAGFIPPIFAAASGYPIFNQSSEIGKQLLAFYKFLCDGQDTLHVKSYVFKQPPKICHDNSLLSMVSQLIANITDTPTISLDCVDKQPELGRYSMLFLYSLLFFLTTLCLAGIFIVGNKSEPEGRERNHITQRSSTDSLTSLEAVSP